MLKSIIIQFLKNHEKQKNFSEKLNSNFSENQEKYDLDAFHQKNYAQNELRVLKLEKKLVNNKGIELLEHNLDHNQPIESIHMNHLNYIDPFSVTQINRMYEQTKNIRESCLSLDEKYELILEFNKSKVDGIFKQLEKDFNYKNKIEKTQEEQIDDFINFFGKQVIQINKEVNKDFMIA